MSDFMQDVTSLAKRRGFIFWGSEIYGGLANTYDYGPTGAELLRNIRNLWWDYFVTQRSDIVGLDASLISSYKVWDASGHTKGFNDALVDCKKCKLRKRADHLIEDYLEANSETLQGYTQRIDHIEEGLDKDLITKVIATKKVEGLTPEQLSALITQFQIKCPKCGAQDWTQVRKFNLLFPVHLGIIEGEQNLAYLRGETAQGIFINFKNVVDSSRVRLPFGIAQLGKSFRNEVTLGNSVFRTIEFEQGEIEYFFDPDKTAWETLYDEWKGKMWDFVTTVLGIKTDNLRWRIHSDEERSFYSKRTEDLEYNFPFGFKELWGLAYRTDYDLKQHIEYSGADLSITDPETNKKLTPHVIEPAVGINRLFLMILCDAFVKEGDRTVLKLPAKLAPYKVAVFPLVKNKDELVTKARSVYETVQKRWSAVWDDRGNIGKRYYAQDEIGTPFCITVDYDTLENDSVTVRNRDTMQQDRIKLSDLEAYLSEKL